jgi:hypothetical protein
MLSVKTENADVRKDSTNLDVVPVKVSISSVPNHYINQINILVG